ncbi:MAG: peptidoglycan DD-metalloendopeptidase family protein [Gemmatimonadota bacterium]
MRQDTLCLTWTPGRHGRWTIVLLLLLCSTGYGVGVAAQQEPDELRRQIIESQRRLEEIRAERSRLQSEMSSLRSRVEDVTGELQNIERQLSASRSVLAEIEFQVDATTQQVRSNTADLLRTREELLERQAILERRLRDIYKRGPLHTTRVLLGAESFSDLLNRYHYLRLIATYDRALVGQVSELEAALVGQNEELREGLRELGRLRESKLGEVAELRQVETEHEHTLEQFRDREVQTLSRLDQLEADEAQLTDLVAGLERTRLEEERRRVVAGLSTPEGASLSTADIGTLQWPVDGQILYPFGVERRPNGTVLRWNGVGIRAPVGTPVQAVRGGTVALAGPFEGYGPSVIVSHGDGYYTLYLYLEEIGVVEGRQVQTGQIVGTVGGAGTPEGARVEFQVRAPVDGGVPRAMDPLRWLRPRGGSR